MKNNQFPDRPKIIGLDGKPLTTDPVADLNAKLLSQIEPLTFYSECWHNLKNNIIEGLATCPDPDEATVLEAIQNIMNALEDQLEAGGLRGREKEDQE